MSTKEDLLRKLTVKELRLLAKENGIPLVNKNRWSFGYGLPLSEEAIIEALLKSSKITKKKILEKVESRHRREEKISGKESKIEEEHIEEKIVTEREISRKILTVKEITLETVLEEINEFKKVAPRITRTKKLSPERLYTRELTGYLRRSFPDIKLEQNLGKGTRIDATIGKIGIEVKYRPDQNEINRLYGQTDDYLQYMNNIVIVFFDTDSGTVNDYKMKLERGNYLSRVAVVNI